MEERDIAVTIQNMVQFYSIKNGIDGLVKKGYLVDIYVPSSDDSSGFGEMFDSTYNYLLESNYNPIRTSNENIRYKILLEPYPMDFYIKINYTYRIKYKYSLLSAKPDLVYVPGHNLYYDAILCYGKYEANFLKVYSNTEIIGNLKYINLNKLDKPKTDKPILLYLPTYGDVSSIDSITEQLNKIKDNYYIITKLHHGTSFLQEEKERIDKLKDISDECYDHKIELAELLQKVDVVLSDNSGAVFETIYAKVPLAIYSENINKNKLGNFDTTQYKLIKENYIPYTNEPEKIPQIIIKALSNEYIEKQSKISDDLFYRPEDPVGCFVNIIEKYLQNEIDVDYKNIHDILVNDYENKINEINDLTTKNLEISKLNNELNDSKQEIQNLKNEIEEKNKIIGYYENGKLYKASKSIYNFYHKKIKRSK